tara:strand:- start:738 stop:1076 length:339 start_codon:yes stop_codon:yes gene_type:complete
MYYIYEKSSTLIMGPAGRIARPNHRHSYKTMSAAKAALTRYSKMWWNDTGRFGNEPSSNDPQFRFGICEKELFHQVIEKSRKVTNMMSGKEFVEPVNTPNYMSPASESYWSM